MLLKVEGDGLNILTLQWTKFKDDITSLFENVNIFNKPNITSFATIKFMIKISYFSFEMRKKSTWFNKNIYGAVMQKRLKHIKLE